MGPRTTHWLGVDLLDYALADPVARSVPELDRHLRQCLACRIRLNRIRRAVPDLEPGLSPTLSFPHVAPAILAILAGQRRPSAFRPGQLWLAGTQSDHGLERVLVWLQAVDETVGMTTVLAATLDVHVADHTSLIVDVPSLDRPAAIFTSVPGWIPLDRLDLFVDHIQVGDQIVQLQEHLEQPPVRAGTHNDGDPATGAQPPHQERNVPLRVGPRISGASDERLEFRQVLADQLAELDPESDPPAPAVPITDQ